MSEEPKETDDVTPARAEQGGSGPQSLTAAHDWDVRKEVMTVRPSHPDSFERQSDDSGLSRFPLDMTAAPDLAAALSSRRLQRFVEAIYCPETELGSHYMQTEPAGQYDGWVWFDRTTALLAPTTGMRHVALPRTWPFGLPAHSSNGGPS
ncbi:erythromycin esterase family protein [Paracoccus sp. (in: a-proteobacteria)]|uniref:erythromycin esterase family protein n=1 Tax=Paracoccus sp. TaxID=267 RepID=UPI00396C6358